MKYAILVFGIILSFSSVHAEKPCRTVLLTPQNDEVTFKITNDIGKKETIRVSDMSGVTTLWGYYLVSTNKNQSQLKAMKPYLMRAVQKANRYFEGKAVSADFKEMEKKLNADKDGTQTAQILRDFMKNTYPKVKTEQVDYGKTADKGQKGGRETLEKIFNRHTNLFGDNPDDFDLAASATCKGIQVTWLNAPESFPRAAPEGGGYK